MVTIGQRIGELSLPRDRTLDLACLRRVLTPACVQADQGHCLTYQILPAVETPFLGYTNIYGGLGSSPTSEVGAGRGIRGSSMVLLRPCRDPQERHKVLHASRTFFRS